MLNRLTEPIDRKIRLTYRFDVVRQPCRDISVSQWPGMNTTNEEFARARAALAAAGCDLALLSSIANVTCVSGFEVLRAVGVSAPAAYAAPFAVAPAHDPRATYLEALRAALHQAGLGCAGRLGVEGRALPYGCLSGGELPTSGFDWGL
jgi:hypothetical protein